MRQDQEGGNPPNDHVVVALNFTPVPREGYRIGVPSPGSYQEVFNSDAKTSAAAASRTVPNHHR
jgi:1,4-alpha-glucan branching enzyme